MESVMLPIYIYTLLLSARRVGPRPYPCRSGDPHPSPAPRKGLQRKTYRTTNARTRRGKPDARWGMVTKKVFCMRDCDCRGVDGNFFRCFDDPGVDRDNYMKKSHCTSYNYEFLLLFCGVFSVRIAGGYSGIILSFPYILSPYFHNRLDRLNISCPCPGG
jgi:hypothetical protein